jgi:hypothetical protein
MQIAPPDLNAPATLILDRDHRLTDDESFAFCVVIPNLKLERTREGEVVIVPPPGGESDYRTLEAGAILREWAKRDGRGKPFASSALSCCPMDRDCPPMRHGYPTSALPSCPKVNCGSSCAGKEKNASLGGEWCRAGLADRAPAIFRPPRRGTNVLNHFARLYYRRSPAFIGG